jgi:4-hydroxy-2-oxoheptanedioate aldolase
VTVLAQRLKAGDTLYSAWSTLPGSLIVEVLARLDFDCVTFDVQHGLHDVASLAGGVGAAALSGKPSLVRIPVADNAFASRAVDMGAEAIIAPMINSAADARALVAAVKYPPLGERSWGPRRAIGLSGLSPQAHIEAANANTLAMAMIETTAALAALDAILAVPGIDGVFVGPSDLSVTLSEGRRIAPLDANLDATIAQVAERATAAGKFAGVFCATAARARQFRDYGYRFIALATDHDYLVAGATAMLETSR